MGPEFCQAVWAAAERGEVREAVAGVYAELAARVERRRPICALSGCCCRFEEFGHRLYVTTMELAAFVCDFPPRERMTHRLREAIERWTGRGCPFQVDKLCGVHWIRPFGCRVFFCDSSSVEWQHELYEQLHGRLRRLHEELGVAYYYCEWREGLRAVFGATGGGGPLGGSGL